MKKNPTEKAAARFPDVLFEDNHLLIVNKRASDIVQGDKTGDMPLVEIMKEYIAEKYKKPGNVFLGVVHRIDRPVSGVLIFAKTSKALSRMTEVFRTRNVQKIYWAVVKNRPQKPEDTLVHYLLKNEKNNLSKAYKEEIKGSKRSELHYKILCSSDRYHLLEVLPYTGRHHQIRSQLSKIGCSIKGDLKYGSERSNPDASIHLHARKIIFEHPVTHETIAVTAPVPEENLWMAFEKMAENA